VYHQFHRIGRLFSREMYILVSIHEVEMLKIPLHNIHTSNFVFTLSAFGLNQME
jgi:hypothetical protein